MDEIGYIRPTITTSRTSKHLILVLTEDKTAGHRIYRELLKSIYPDIWFYTDTTGGFGGILNTLEDYTVNEISTKGTANKLFTDYILIYDSGANKEVMRDINKKLRKFRKCHPEQASKLKLFTPLYTEELLVSFTELGYTANIDNSSEYYDLYDWYIDIVTGRRTNRLEFMLELQNRTEGKTLENAFEQFVGELTQETQYSYLHGDSDSTAMISECWFSKCECCKSVRNYRCNELKTPEELKSKIGYIAHESLLVGILYIVDSILDLHFRDYLCSTIIDFKNRVSNANRHMYEGI